LVLGLSAALVSAGGAAGAADSVAVEVLESNAERTVIRYEIGAFEQRPVIVDGIPFTELLLDGESVTKEVGAPALPLVCRSIIIPDDAAMEVHVLDAAFEEVGDIDVTPSKGFIPRTIDPADVPWKFGDAYEIDAFHPGPLAGLSDPYIMRDHRGLVVQVYPFQYNPQQRVLRVYTDITLEIVTAGPGQVNVLRRPAHLRALSRAFHDVYDAHFINYMGARYVPLDEVGDMLIICHDPWIPQVEPLAAHKVSIGIDTTIVPVSSIGNNATAIKAHIQQVYDTSDLAFVLLVGDGQHVEPPLYGGDASDPSYSLLAGSDSYPEIMVGRFSAESPAHVTTQVDRTIEYELMPATLQDWYWRGMGVASSQGAGIGDDGEADYVHLNNIRAQLLANGYTEMDQIYDPSATASMVTAGLNAGRGVVFYTGHGSTTAWSTSGFSNSHVNALVNDSMLPFISSVACVNGNFDGPTCFAEAWLRATNGDAPTGAIGCYASSINQSWAPPMEQQDEMANLMVAQAYSSLGALLYAGSCSMMDDYGGGGVDMFRTWHLFGDPSVCVIGVVEPVGLAVDPSVDLVSAGPAGGPFTPSSIDYTLTNSGDEPIVWEATADVPWVEVSEAGGALPAGGDVVVTVSIGSEAEIFDNGEYEAIVTFANMTDHSGDTARSVALDVGVAVPMYVYDLDVQPASFVTGEWEFGPPQGQGGVSNGNPDPSSAATGTNVFGVNLAGDYSMVLGGPWYVSIRAVDCQDLFQVQLKFMRWLHTDAAPYATATVEVSTDGIDWETVWENGDAPITDGSWTEQVLNISDLADHQESVYLRFGYGIHSGASPYSGWNIDDVEVWGVPPTAPCPGDIDGDGDVGVTDFLALLAAWGPNAGHPADLDGDGEVGVTDFLALLAAWGPCP
jgi:hypothetical protein